MTRKQESFRFKEKRRSFRTRYNYLNPSQKAELFVIVGVAAASVLLIGLFVF